MVEVFLPGRMDANMRANTLTILKTEEGFSLVQTENFMMDNGKQVNKMEKVFLRTKLWMPHDVECGKMENE